MNDFDMLGKKSGVVVPFDSVPLPSEGKLYPVDHPLHGQTTVDIKAMTAIEEDILWSQALIKKGTVLSVLIKSCLMNKSIDPGSLLLGDKTSILLAIRIGGFGIDYSVNTTCPEPECSKQFSVVFDLSQIKLKKIGDGLSGPEKEAIMNVKENLFKYHLPKSKTEVQFSLLTDAEDLEISKNQELQQKALKKQGIVSDVEHTLSDKLIYSIKKFGNETDKGKIAQLVKNMPAMDSRSLRSYMNKIEPDMLFEQVVDCPHCGSRENHTIPMTLQFFWPSN